MIGTLLLQMGMQITDAIMMGRLSSEALAAGALAIAFTEMVLLTIYGFLSANGVELAHAMTGQPKQVLKLFHSGLLFAVLLLIPSMIIFYFTPHFLTVIGQNPTIVKLTQQYLHVFIWALPPIFITTILEGYLAAIKRPYIITFCMIMAIFLNFLFILFFSFQLWHIFSPMGVEGIALATTLTEVIICLVLFWGSHRELKKRGLSLFSLKIQFSTSMLLKTWRLGWPLGVRNLFEVGLFSFTSVMMGYFGKVQLAAHQIAYQCISFSIMFPVGIGQAGSVLAARALGQNQTGPAKNFCVAALILSAVCAFFGMIIYIVFPTPIAHLFLHSANGTHLSLEQLNIIHYAKLFLLIAGLFQLFDATQVTLSFCLRSYKDTFAPMLIGLLSYWGIGISSGIMLAFILHLQGVGLWLGLAFGVLMASILMGYRLKVYAQTILN